jgi:3-deoxy-D-manno-octulosonic-acid transferase
MGKSLTVHGGQNPVEPIVARRPVVFGPHMENFAALARSLIASGGARQCQNETSLTNKIRTLLRNPAEREELVARAQEVLDRHRGATGRTAELLHELRPRPG